MPSTYLICQRPIFCSREKSFKRKKQMQHVFNQIWDLFFFARRSNALSNMMLQTKFYLYTQCKKDGKSFLLNNNVYLFSLKLTVKVDVILFPFLVLYPLKLSRYPIGIQIKAMNSISISNYRKKLTMI